MEFNKLLADFSERHGIADLSAEDNAVALDIDGIVVTIASNVDVLMISADIGEPPTEGKAEFAELMLEANLQSDAFFAKSSESDTYILVRRLALPMLEADAFDVALEALVNLAESWRRMLADFRPVAKTLTEQNSETPLFGTSGFVQV